MRAFRWLQREYKGTYERTEPIQTFISEHPKFQGIRGRIIQSVINRHLDPKPRGPTIYIHQPRQIVLKKMKGPVLGCWAVYLPPRLRAELQQLSAQWQQWLYTYIVRTLGANPIKKNLVRSYVTQVYPAGCFSRHCCIPSPEKGTFWGEQTAWYRVLFLQLQCEQLDHFFSLHRPNLALAIVEKNPLHIHQRRLCRIALNHFLGGVVLREYPVIAQRLHLRSRDVPSCRTVDDDGEHDHPATTVACSAGHVRDHFTQAEMDAILTLTELSLRDRIILHIMAETGLRRRAVSWLLVDSVFDRRANSCLPVARALEKGLVVRPFRLSSGTSELLQRYILDDHPGVHVRWLFPSPKKSNTQPITPSVVNSVLLRACHMANIRGRHTHSHGIRKFVVCSLLQAKNRIEDVAKWLGHWSLDITVGTYWDVHGEEVASAMNIPWL